jgi:hypothetical protein
MKKPVLLSVLVAVLLTVAWVALWAEHPATISCPIDGEGMVFDHLVVGQNQTGPGPHNACWYKHTVLYQGQRQTHTAYVPCEN